MKLYKIDYKDISGDRQQCRYRYILTDDILDHLNRYFSNNQGFRKLTSVTFIDEEVIIEDGSLPSGCNIRCNNK